MAELIVIFILYVIAAAALSSESASIEFTAFVIFASIFTGSLRRYLLARKEAEHWRELQARMKGLELNQQQVLRRLHELEHPTAVAAREAKPAPATQPAAKPVTPPAPHIPPSAPPPTHVSAPPAAARVTSPVGQPAGMRAPTAPSFAGYASAPPPKPKRNWEETIGTNWLAKISVAMLVVGIAVFLSWHCNHMTPLPRIGLAMLAGGGGVTFPAFF